MCRYLLPIPPKRKSAPDESGACLKEWLGATPNPPPFKNRLQQQPAQGETAGATCYQASKQDDNGSTGFSLSMWLLGKSGSGTLSSEARHPGGTIAGEYSCTGNPLEQNPPIPPPAWTHVQPANQHCFQLSQPLMTTSEPSGSIRRYITNGAGCHRFLRSHELTELRSLSLVELTRKLF